MLTSNSNGLLDLFKTQHTTDSKNHSRYIDEIKTAFLDLALKTPKGSQTNVRHLETLHPKL